MIGLIAAWLLPRVGARVARPLAWLGTLALLLAIGGVLQLAVHRWADAIADAAVKDERVRVAADAAAAKELADARARIEAERQRSQNDANDRDVRTAAQAGDDRPVGRGTGAVLERVREQQAAGRR